MKRFNFFKYTTIANKVHTAYFDYWFFNKLTQGGEAPTEPVEGEGTEFTLSPTSNKKLAVVTPKGDTTQNTLSGKNKLNFATAEATTSATTLTLVDNGFVSATDDGYGVKINNIPVQPSTTYSISCLLDYISEGASGARIFVNKGATSTSSSYIRLQSLAEGIVTGTFTTDSEEEAINVWFYNSNAKVTSTVKWTDIQLEVGSVTAYEPYCGGVPSPNPSYPQDVNVVTGTQTLTITNGTDEQTYPITLGSVELCKIGTYQDYIYKENDKWYVHNANGKETLTGGSSEQWNAYTWDNTGEIYFAHKILTSVSGSYVITLFSNYYTPNPNRNNYCFALNNHNLIVGSQNIASDATGYKTWLSTHNLVVYYPLDEPTDTEITDTTLLSNLNTLFTDGYLKKGTNTIQTTATGTNLPTIIYIKTN